MALDKVHNHPSSRSPVWVQLSVSMATCALNFEIHFLWMFMHISLRNGTFTENKRCINTVRTKTFEYWNIPPQCFIAHAKIRLQRRKTSSRRASTTAVGNKERCWQSTENALSLSELHCESLKFILQWAFLNTCWLRLLLVSLAIREPALGDRASIDRYYWFNCQKKVYAQ